MKRISVFLSKYLLIVFFIAVIFAVPLLTKLEKPSDISVAENRALALPPVLCAENVFDGEYFAGWETYLSDHIYRRDDWLRTYVAYQLALGHKIVRDVVITDTALLPYVASDAANEWADAAASQTAEGLRALSDYVAERGGVFLYVNVPEQCSMLRGLYPDGLYDGSLYIDSNNDAFRAAMSYKGVNYLEMRPVFAASGNAAEFYSQTDHHYNLRGAYLTYTTLCAELRKHGVGISADESVTFHTLNNTFYGSRGRKIYNLTAFNDKLEYITAGDAPSFTRFDNGARVNSYVYALPADESEDVAYTLYMGGDVGATVIDTGRPELPTVLIFGDSFTNALETVLYLSCDKMIAVDLRYNDTPIRDYIDKYKPDAVICLRDDTAILSADGNGSIG